MRQWAFHQSTIFIRSKQRLGEEQLVTMDFSAAASRFSDDLIRLVVPPNHAENALISPLSMLTCLSMLLVGTKSNSRTQLTNALRLPSDASQYDLDSYFNTLMTSYKSMDEKKGKLLVNNMALVSDQKQLLTQFEETVRNRYNAEVSSVDFEKKADEIKNLVNQWVNSTTQGLIPILLEEPPKPETVLMLLNSIYFEANWYKLFGDAYPREFYQSKNEVKNASFMPVKERFWYMEVPFGETGENIQMVELPYRSDSSSMILMLPPKSKSINDVLHEKSMFDLINQFNDNGTVIKVDLHMPKFKFNTKAQMEKYLKKMGAVDLFENNADLTGITGDALKVDGITHATSIEVDEYGTKAAAVTSISVVEITSLMPNDKVEMVLDRPFAFCIYDRVAKLPIFVGKLSDPTN